MNSDEKYDFIQEKIKTGPKFFSFKYKKENGEISFRNVQLGAEIPQAFERRVGKASGKGNWHRNRTGGRGKGTIYSGKRPLYVRGIDMADKKVKIFSLPGISEIKCGSQKW